LASRRYRSKNSLNGNIVHVNNRLADVEKRKTISTLGEGVVDSVVIGSEAVGTGSIQKQSITSDLIASDAVGTSAIQNYAVTDQKIFSVDGSKITGTISGARIGSGVNANNISVGTLSVSVFPTTGVSANIITIGTLGANVIVSNSVRWGGYRLIAVANTNPVGGSNGDVWIKIAD
jgi:hypothetical protein